jgi:hypothetical protein
MLVHTVKLKNLTSNKAFFVLVDHDYMVIINVSCFKLSNRCLVITTNLNVVMLWNYKQKELENSM